MIKFSCHQCGKQFALKPEFAGRSTTCSSCKQALVVPTPLETMAYSPEAAETVAPAVPPKIAFSCRTCGLKFNVPAEFAGRSTKCPTCKEPLTVPAAGETVAYEPAAGQIQGAPSCLARAGVAGGVTLQGHADAESHPTSLEELLDGKSNDGARYVIESELARGGMGAVLRAVDCDIRREVAVKYLLDQSDRDKKIRFVEEAQITGQLEHPNIVPIHELGVDAKKRIFFSMKMVKGRSLAQILKAQRPISPLPSGGEGPGVRGSGLVAAEKEYSLGRLLNIFVNICNGLAYAHSRGVVHRDLKPANIMVGDFGEVYVMDWGLAKVLKKGGAAPDTGPVMAIPVAALADPTGPFVFSNMPASAPLATPVVSSPSASNSGSGKIVTSRDLEAELTHEGSVLGTPVYMPPEQATGQTHAIDERSDVYSMGAILYEILTLQPPIDKGGGFPAIVKRVTEGQIEAPEKKNPERARAGNVPAELAAVALKALALRREDRYQTIEDLRKDVERFMEGRSVSAKHDTVREAIFKLVKRNQGVSIATATAAVVLGIVAIWSLVAILGANARTQKAYDEYRAEQVSKREQAKKSVPAFVRAARLLLNENKFSDAMAQVDTALFFDEDEIDARFLRGQMLIGKQDYKAAQTEFQKCLKLKPDYAAAKNLAQLCAKTSPENSGQLLALADELGRQRAFTLADQVTQQAEKLGASRKELLAHYQNRIEAAWPGRRPTLGFPKAERITLSFQSFQTVEDLTPLQGMKLSTLDLRGCRNIIDLTPLKGMPLTNLDLLDCQKISDLTPLKGMRITILRLQGCLRITDLAPLNGMPLSDLTLQGCAKITDLTPLAGMKLISFGMVGCPVSDLTPLKGMPLVTLDVVDCKVTDLTPLKGMALERLNLSDCKVSDLTPLKGMPLTYVALQGTRVTDLTPLKGMSLTYLNLHGVAAKDLTPLKGMPLTFLQFHAKQEDLEMLRSMPLQSLRLPNSSVSDWNALKGMKLTLLNVAGNPTFSDLTVLASMELQDLSLEGCMVKDLTPLKGMPITRLDMTNCTVLHDLTPLAGMSLTHVNLPPQVTKGMEGLRKMKTLQKINNESPDVFWKKWDASKAK